MNEIMIKTKFNGWRPISEKDALDHARWKIKNITTGKSDEDSLEMINTNLKGISFTLDQLL